MVCRKIRFYPNAEQSRLFKRCLGTTRFFFNRANAFVKQRTLEIKTARLTELKQLAERGCTHVYKAGGRKGEQCCSSIQDGCDFFCSKHKDGPLGMKYDCMTLPSLRKAVLTSDKDLTADEAWQKEVPYDTRQLAIKALLDCYESQFALKKAGLAPKVFVGFRSRKAPRQTFSVSSKALDLEKMQIFKRRLKGKKARLRLRKRDLVKVPENCGDLTVLWTRPGKWYLCLPCEVKAKEMPIYDSPKYKSVFLDPGVRTFQTFYSPDGACGKLGKGYYDNVVLPLQQRVDLLTSVAAKAKSRTKRNLRRRCCVLRTKARNVVDDLHRKTCHFLCGAFDAVFIPPFETQRMAARAGRKINSAATRGMLSLAHYRFRKRLEDYASRTGTAVYVVGEGMTTKTCGGCGHLNDVGGSARYSCAACGLVADRDYAAARNICLRTATQCARLVADQ